MTGPAGEILRTAKPLGVASAHFRLGCWTFGSSDSGGGSVLAPPFAAFWPSEDFCVSFFGGASYASTAPASSPCPSSDDENYTKRGSSLSTP